MISIDILGQPRVLAILQALDKALDTTEILDEGAAVLLARNRQRFLAQVDPDNQPWPPSKAALKRALTGKGGGTLFRTGRLFHSIQLARSTFSERFIGTDVPYAKYHQDRSQYPSARIFMGFNEDDVSVLNRLVIRRVQNGLAGLS
jgi:phage virion morphogenesis protein